MTKEKKKRGCFGCLSWIAIIVVGFLILGFIASMFSEDESDRNDNNNESTSQREEVEKEVVEDQEEFEDEQEEEVEIVDEEEVEEINVVEENEVEEESKEEFVEEQEDIENIEEHLNSFEHVHSFEKITETYTTGPASDLNEFDVSDSEEYRIIISKHDSFFTSHTKSFVQEVIQKINNSELEYDFIVFELYDYPIDIEPNLRYEYFRIDEDTIKNLAMIDEVNEMYDELKKESDFFLEGIEADYGFGTEDIPPSPEEELIGRFKHEVIEGVDVYTLFKDSAWSANSLMSNFSMDSVELLQAVHEDLENGIVFRLATTMVDDYGNESNKIVANVWYSQNTVERINYDNWPVHGDKLSGLYNTADGVRIYFGLAADIDQDQKPTDYAPQFYYDSIYEEYED